MIVKAVIRGWRVRQPNQIRTIDIPGEEIRESTKKFPSLKLAIAEAAFKYGQNDFQPKNVRSLSVGDVVIIDKNIFAIVDTVGFVFTTKKGMQKYMKIPPLEAYHWGNTEAEEDYAEYAKKTGRPMLNRSSKDIERQRSLIDITFGKYKATTKYDPEATDVANYNTWYLEENGIPVSVGNDQPAGLPKRVRGLPGKPRKFVKKSSPGVKRL
jgi:hypothetical protein